MADPILLRSDSVGIAFIACGVVQVITAGHPHGRPIGWAVGLLTWAALVGWQAYRRHRSPGRVLIVEDHEQLSSLFARFFSHAGWTVSTAGTVAAARTFLGGPARSRPDWLVTDMMLPDGTGTEIIRHARTLRPSPRIAVITGAYPPGSPAWCEAEGLGVDMMLKKPVRMEELVKMMESRS